MTDSIKIPANGISVEIPSSKTISPSNSSHEDVLREAIQGAKKSLEDTVANNTDSDGNPLLRATGKRENVVNHKGYEETKKIIDTFHHRMERYAKYLTRDGATILCVKIATTDKEVPQIWLFELPTEDRDTIKEMIKNTHYANADKFTVQLDSCKDFKISFEQEPQKEYYLFNSVIHPKPSNVASDIPIKNDGETVSIGGKINLNKKDVQKLIGVENERDEEVEPYQKKRTPVSGRNAYELRSDIMQMAVDYGYYSKRQIDPDELVNIARKFYSFVENKR